MAFRRSGALPVMLLLAGCSAGGSGGADAGTSDAGRDTGAFDATAADGGDDSSSDDGSAMDASMQDAPPDAPTESGPSLPPPVVLASDVPNPTMLVTDGVFLYWTDFVLTDAGATLGRVMKMPVGGGAETTLASEPGRSTLGLAVDGARVYWVDDHGALSAASLDGGAPAALYGSAGATAIATDGVAVYTATAAGTSIAIVPLDGGGVTLLPSSCSVTAPAGVSIDGVNVYWPAPDVSSILGASKAGGVPFTLASNGGLDAGAYVSGSQYQNAVSDGTSVYWSLPPGGPVYPSGGILGVALATIVDAGVEGGLDAALDGSSDAGADAAAGDGGLYSLVYDAGGVAPFSVATDGARVFCLVGGNTPSLVEIPLDGGAAVTLATNLFSSAITGDPGPTLAVDGTNVYWLSPPQILRVAK